MLGGIALAWLGRLVVRPDPAAHASVAQCGFRFNTYLALSWPAACPGPARRRPWRSRGLRRAHQQYRRGARPGHTPWRKRPAGDQRAIPSSWPRWLRWPTILQVPIPHVLDIALGRLGSCALAIGLLCVGAALSLRGGRAHAPLMAWMVASKLVLLPPVALTLAWALDTVGQANGWCWSCSAPCPRLRRPTCWPPAWAATAAWWRSPCR